MDLPWLPRKALPKDGAAPFVRARLGGASGAGAAAQRTETAAGVAPRWDGTPFVFEAQRGMAAVQQKEVKHGTSAGINYV